ncbi:hypothetical protein [Flagellimonas flava]|uniref:hypothetical protein n=1 Tax=Flagellimonas TaxID=444459 RepID=UPI003D65CF9C
MIKRSCILLFILSSISLSGQTDMLIGQISGRTVARENFDEDGVFLNKQTFEAGKIIKRDGYYQIQVITELFDDEGKSTEKYTTTYRCKPAEAIVMVMAFPFAKPKSKETEINTASANFKELYNLENLEDIELEMTFDSGLLDFFGSKSKIRIYERKLDRNKESIISKINIKAYTLGIRIKQLNYNVVEKLSDNGLLTFQKFTEQDKSYFTMTYTEPE